MAKQQYPEPTVGTLIFNPEGKILLIKSHKWKNKYTVPGGHVELGEKLKEALKREIKEETGLNIYDIKFICFHEFIYSPEFWKKRHFIFFDFSCKTDSNKVTLNNEVEDYIWVRVEDSLKLNIDSYTRKTIEKYIKSLRHTS